MQVIQGAFSAAMAKLCSYPSTTNHRILNNPNVSRDWEVK